MSKGWHEQHVAQPGVSFVASFVASVDVGLVHDPSVICVAHRDAERRRRVNDLTSLATLREVRPLEERR
jgi:hypothetical protein